MRIIDKKKYGVIFLIILMVLAAYNWKQIFLTEIPINYFCTLPIVPELPYIKYPETKHYEWFMVTNEPQCKFWINSGLDLPKCDFSQNYLIVSKYKMKELHYTTIEFDNHCEAPSGIASLDKQNSVPGKAYIYKMPKVILQQGIG